MHTKSRDELAEKLAHNRRAGIVSDLLLERLRSRAEAGAIQAAALDAYAEDFSGYALVATSEPCRRMLGLKRPIYAAIPDTSHHAGGSCIHLPQGMIGAQCELAFTLGRTFPNGTESIDRHSASDAILACQPTIGLLGRRVRPGPESELIAIADFALHVATICGPLVETGDRLALDLIMMTARIDGKPVITANAGAIMAHPLDALVWLAQELARQDRQLSAGDIVTTGSCAPVLQVLPGQHLTVEFETLGVASCRFD